MKSHARAVVIGGGVVGVSTLYHLTKKGWGDVMLLERKELTSGSTWHAAGLLPLYNLSYSVGQLHKYSVDLYPRIQEETGMDVGFRQVSNIRLASEQDRWDEFMFYVGVAKTIGVEVEVLTPEQVKKLWPLCQADDLIGAVRHPQDGYIQPAGITQALAQGARASGAEIHRNTPVRAIERKPSGEWLVKTDKGDVTCEHVITATGSFARKTGAMVGLDIPVIPVEHQYIVTEAHPAIRERKAQGLPEMGVLRDTKAAFYMREEAGGLLLGPYETGAPCCYVDGPDDESEYELFQEDVDRLEPHIEAAIARVPAFGEVGSKKVYNGAIAYTPDGAPIIGPAWGLRNFWLSEGHSFGVTAAGGAGWQMAEWIVEGEPSIDMMDVDPRRFGPYAGRGYLRAKNEEAYRNMYTVHYPDEERPAARPLKQAPCYDRMAARGAVFGQVYGWERPNWFAPEDMEARDVWSFRRSNYFEPVGEECRHVHENVGLLDMSAFAKFEVEGTGAAGWLDSILANRIPRSIGRIGLCHLLSGNGGVRSEFTVCRTGQESFYLVSAGAFERHDHDTLTRLLPNDDSVQLRKVTTQIGVLVLAGPQSRQLLTKVSDADFSNAAFPWLSARRVDIGVAQALAMRVNFVGELGWELHHPIEMQNHIFDLLMGEGESLNLRPFGIRAMNSLRLEKSYRLIPRELSIEYAALESGLDRFIRTDKNAFIGRDALLSWKERGFRYGFATLEIHDIENVDARGSEPVFIGDALAGRCTSGGYGWRLGKSLALAMLEREHAAIGTEMEVEILGKRHKAVVLEESPFDPRNELLRA